MQVREDHLSDLVIAPSNKRKMEILGHNFIQSSSAPEAKQGLPLGLMIFLSVPEIFVCELHPLSAHPA